MREISVSDNISNRDGVVKIDYGKVKETIRKCKESPNSTQCEKALADIGLKFE